ncbi:kyphoscoliosis peptidase-like [Ambystoma mexicanum]|uniref:kyphoscoliosis peptidase-like n=1 Tax=Ambystoma mexicanum TaxID=8296 RepID=UPI0037E77CEA
MPSKRKAADYKSNDAKRFKPTIQTSGYPWDGSSLKSMKFDLNKFKKLDSYATQVDVKSSDPEDLLRILLLEAHTDLEKVRAIWIWICHHIEYDTVGYHNEAARSLDPNVIMQTRKGVCIGYARLFERLCSAAGTQCVLLLGYAKEYGCRLGHSSTLGIYHAWNAVHLNGSWHLLDSTWGAGRFNGNCTQFQFSYNEFYFLTHPAIFIEDHFPDKRDWQLLNPPLSKRQYMNSLCHHYGFYNMGLITACPKTAVIKTVKGRSSISIEGRTQTLFMFHLNGTEKSCLMTLKKYGMKLEVYPRVTGRHKLQIFAKPFNSSDIYTSVLEYIVECRSVDKTMRIPKELYYPVGPSWLSEKKGLLEPSHPDPIIHTLDGCCSVSFTLKEQMDIFATLYTDEIKMTDQIKRRHILQLQQERFVQFWIQLPQAGSYVLHIYAKNKSKPFDFQCVCNYLVSCRNAKVQWPAFPRMLHNPAGPNWQMTKIGFLQPSHNDPIIHTAHGYCSVSFTLKRNMNVFATLHTDELKMTEKIKRRHILQVQREKSVEFQIQLPQAGSYALQIYTENKTHPFDTQYVCNYLLICTDSKVEHPAFSKMLHNPVGPNWQMEKIGFTQPSQLDPVIHTIDGCCTIRFKLKKNMDIFATLHTDDMTMTNQIKRNYILQVQQDRVVEFLIHLPQAGSYALQIYAGSKSDSGYLQFVCNYLLSCTNPKVQWPAFPRKLQNPVGPNWRMKKVGFLLPSHSEPIIHTLDGRCSVSFTLERHLDIYATLHTDDLVMTKDLKSRHILKHQHRKGVTFQMQLPQTGSYALSIFAKKENVGQHYDNICNYLLSCANTTVNWPVFPLTFNSWLDEYELVEPTTGILPTNQNVCFKLKIPGVSSAFISTGKEWPLILSNDGYWEGTLNTTECRDVNVMVQKAHIKNSIAILNYQVQTQ